MKEEHVREIVKEELAAITTSSQVKLYGEVDPVTLGQFQSKTLEHQGGES